MNQTETIEHTTKCDKSENQIANHDQTCNEEDKARSTNCMSEKTFVAGNDVHTRRKTSENGEGSDEDMLHNLLGVESSTIDQIFAARDSAASLLGV